MAKDPAFLFYPGDWLGGTATFSRHLKGCYMDLLLAQFNAGPLSIDEIKTVLNNDFAAWGTLVKKFKKTENGLFFNERLALEQEKRKKFIVKQGDNGALGGRPNKPKLNPKNNPNKTLLENKNEDGNNNEFEDKGGVGEEGFFRINGETIFIPVSAWFKKEFPRFIEQWCMNNKDVDLKDVYDGMDTKYHSTDFDGRNHVKNAFQKTGETLIASGKNKKGQSNFKKANDELNAGLDQIKRTHGNNG